MITNNSNGNDAVLESYLTDDKAFVQEAVAKAVPAALEGEMTEHLDLAKSERIAMRKCDRSRVYSRKLHMRAGTIGLRVPQSRDGTFSTQMFARYCRSEKALVSTLIEMYVNGVSTWKVGKLAERLYGREFSKATISNMVATLDPELTAFASRRLDDVELPCVIRDARYEKVREGGANRGRRGSQGPSTRDDGGSGGRGKRSQLGSLSRRA